MPRDVTNLWTFVTELDHDSLMAMFTHCVALTVNAVNLPWERKPRALARLAAFASTRAASQLQPATARRLPMSCFFICAIRPAVSSLTASRTGSPW